VFVLHVYFVQSRSFKFKLKGQKNPKIDSRSLGVESKEDVIPNAVSREPYPPVCRINWV